MKCPRCQHENKSEAKFCEACAVPLARTCGQCGHLLSRTARFCPACAHPIGFAEGSPVVRFDSPENYTPKHLAERILDSKAHLEGERKQVTVLFADLQGSMELLADRDPEEARQILDPVLERMMEAVHRYDGTVNQVMGDGIMALFGAPLAHEDHAVRACYAALRMQELVNRYAQDARRAHGVNVQIRVGLNSGEVVVRAIGNDLRMDYSAVGQTTHLAARMEQLASPGSILVAPSTLALAEGFVSVRPLGPVPVKGLAGAVEIFEVTGAGPARTRLQAAARRGLTQFVGRDAELERLRWAQSLAADGHGQIAAIVGEAGVGKSRLVHEFIHSHRLPGWLVLEGGSVSYGKATSYLPVIDLLRGYFGVQQLDDLRQIREKVTGKLLALDDSLKPTLPALLALLDVPVDDAFGWRKLDPGQRRQETLDAVRRLLICEARQQPLLLVFEDLHWTDSETQALLDALVESLKSARLLMLVNYRPEYQHSWGGKNSYSQLRLEALAVESAGHLLDVLLGDDPGLTLFKQRLVKRGNPFFLEETVRTLVETKALTGERGHYRLAQPVQAIQVPATVQAMLAARIDRLPPEHKRLLQIASVIGKDVPFALLQRVAEIPDEALQRGLDHLQAAAFLDQTGSYSDFEYAFVHALTHEVAYGGLLQERRRELHARIVNAIELLHSDRLGEHIERLAHHALRGVRNERAVHHLRQAGLKAATRSALSDARVWFEQALVTLEALPQSQATLEQAFEIRLELRPVLLQQLGEGREALQRLREAETIAEKLNDDHRRGRVCAFLTNIHALQGELDEALATGNRALAIARALEDPELRILTMSYLDQAHYFRGDYERVVELVNENLDLLRADWAYENFGNAAPASVYDRHWLILSLAQLGRFAEAAEQETDAMRLANPTKHAFTVGVTYFAASTLHLLQGNWTRARSLIEHGVAVLRTANVVLMLPLLVAPSAWVLAQLGEASEALSRVHEGEQLIEHLAARGIVAHGGWVNCSLGRACLLLGGLDEARRFADRALQSSACHPGFAAHAQHLLGDIATQRDHFDGASGEAHYHTALALAEPRGMRPLVAHCHLGLGKLRRSTGNREQAEEHLSTATKMYRTMDMAFWLEQAEAEMGGLA
jgi:class 3 adenylate cyclase/tetratricopeptide (TPR) repeat protein